jgi:hypothetical protein
MHHFDNVGLYDALFVMQDKETKTLWNHITGEALYGPLVGRTLGPLTNLLQMTVKQGLEVDPDMRVAISDRVYFAGGRQLGTASGFGLNRGAGPPRGATPGGAGRGAGPRPALDNPNARLSEMFIQTLGKEDDRRPRMDMGLGIWTETTHRYYPVERIRERGDAFVDQLDGRAVLIYIEPESSTPYALFVTAKTAKLQGKEIRLDDGGVVRSGVLLDRRGQRQPMARPQQIFTRWYGFALTFPGSEVFGQ